MLRKYVVTGNPLLNLGGVTASPGDIIELPVQLADHPVAMGALRLAPEDAPLTAVEPEPPKKTAAKPKAKK